MVICDGFNKIKDVNLNGKSKAMPFPQLPLETKSVNSITRIKPNNVASVANYDNLRNIDSDDSMITSPEKSN